MNQDTDKDISRTYIVTNIYMTNEYVTYLRPDLRPTVYMFIYVLCSYMSYVYVYVHICPICSYMYMFIYVLACVPIYVVYSVQHIYIAYSIHWYQKLF